MKKKRLRRLLKKDKRSFLLRLPIQTFMELIRLADDNNSSINFAVVRLIEDELLKRRETEKEKIYGLG